MNCRACGVEIWNGPGFCEDCLKIPAGGIGAEKGRCPGCNAKGETRECAGCEQTRCLRCPRSIVCSDGDFYCGRCVSKLAVALGAEYELPESDMDELVGARLEALLGQTDLDVLVDWKLCADVGLTFAESAWFLAMSARTVN